LNIFKVKVVACDPREGGRMTLPLDALVDTSCDLTWLPKDMLLGIGIAPRHTRTFFLPGKLPAEREIGQVMLNANGHKVLEEVVFAEPGDAIVIGAQTLQRLGVPIEEGRFVSMASLTTFCLTEKETISKAA
jgi:predicted aspartyl protease